MSFSWYLCDRVRSFYFLYISSTAVMYWLGVSGFEKPSWSRSKGCSGDGTWRNAIPVNILEPERHSSKWCWSQVEHGYCSIPLGHCPILRYSPNVIILVNHFWHVQKSRDPRVPHCQKAELGLLQINSNSLRRHSNQPEAYFWMPLQGVLIFPRQSL